jgi:hypothetical protein
VKRRSDTRYTTQASYSIHKNQVLVESSGINKKKSNKLNVDIRLNVCKKPNTHRMISMTKNNLILVLGLMYSSIGLSQGGVITGAIERAAIRSMENAAAKSLTPSLEREVLRQSLQSQERLLLEGGSINSERLMIEKMLKGFSENAMHKAPKPIEIEITKDPRLKRLLETRVTPGAAPVPKKTSSNTNRETIKDPMLKGLVEKTVSPEAVPAPKSPPKRVETSPKPTDRSADEVKPAPLKAEPNYFDHYNRAHFFDVKPLRNDMYLFDFKRLKAEQKFNKNLLQHSLLQQEVLGTLGYYPSQGGVKSEVALQQAIKQYNEEHDLHIPGKFELKDSAALRTFSFQPMLKKYTTLFERLGYASPSAEAGLPELKTTIKAFQQAQKLPLSERMDAATRAQAKAVFAERARKLHVLGLLPAAAISDEAAISAALQEFGARQQKTEVLEAEQALNQEWEYLADQLLRLGFGKKSSTRDLAALIQEVQGYLGQDPNPVAIQYPSITAFVVKELALVDHLLKPQTQPCELKVIRDNDFVFRYLDRGDRKVVLHKVENWWELLEIDVNAEVVVDRQIGGSIEYSFEEQYGLVLAERSTDSLGYLYVSRLRSPEHKVRVQLGPTVLWLPEAQGRVVIDARADSLLKAYFSRTERSVMIGYEEAELEVDLEVEVGVETETDLDVDLDLNWEELWGIQAELNEVAMDVQHRIHFITCLNKNYKAPVLLPQIGSLAEIDLGELPSGEAWKELGKLAKKWEKALKDLEEKSAVEPSVSIEVSTRTEEEWVIYLDSVSLSQALAGKHVVVLSSTLGGKELLRTMEAQQNGMASLILFQEAADPGAIALFLKALQKILTGDPSVSPAGLELLLQQSWQAALEKAPKAQKAAVEKLRYFQVHRF